MRNTRSIIFAALLPFTFGVAHAAGEKAFLPGEVRLQQRVYADDPFGTRPDRGLVLYQGYLGQTDNETAVLYRPPGRTSFVPMGRNLPGLNLYLKVELTDDRYAREFLDTRMIDFLTTNLVGPHGWPVDASLVAQHEHAGDADGLRSAAVLRRHVVARRVVVSGQAWAVDLVFENRDGSVVAWHVDGSVDPVRIRSIRQDQLEESGTTVPIPVSG